MRQCSDQASGTSEAVQGCPEKSWREVFATRSISEDRIGDLLMVRRSFEEFASHLQGLLPPGEYKDKARHHLELAAMLATKCFSHGG